MRFYTSDRSSKDNKLRYYVPTKLSDNMHETPEGFLVCVGVPIARTGDMIYGEGETPIETDDKGKVTITRDEKEVFRPETITSFEGKPVTIGHPKEFVVPSNWAQLAKGTVQNVRRGEGEYSDSLIADLLITDKTAIGLVKNGLREVSCGYEADYTETGDAKGAQSNIIGNHLALVDQGRAGSSYAINDHKGKGDLTMGLKDKVKALFAKAQDEAMKVIDEGEEKPPEKKEEKAKDAGAYDELVNLVKDLYGKVEAMGKKSDDNSSAAGASGTVEKKAGEEASKDAEGTAGLEERLKACEEKIAQLLESKKPAADDDMGEEDDTEDDDFEETTMTGDTMSRAEILAPGIEKSKDVKVKALKTAYGTKDGKTLIESLNGGKAPDLSSPVKVDMLFIAASELLKANRKSELSKTKQTKDSDFDQGSVIMTAEMMNKKNQEYYKRN